MKKLIQRILSLQKTPDISSQLVHMSWKFTGAMPANRFFIRNNVEKRSIQSMTTGKSLVRNLKQSIKTGTQSQFQKFFVISELKNNYIFTESLPATQVTEIWPRISSTMIPGVIVPLQTLSKIRRSNHDFQNVPKKIWNTYVQN